MEFLKDCPLCHTDNREDYLISKDNLVSKEVFSLEKCAECDFVFTNPRPDYKNINKYYVSEEYTSHSDSKSLYNRIYSIIRNRNVAYKLHLISKYKKGDISIYDYGCGIGTFLQKSKVLGWDIMGYEPNEKAKKLAIKAGIEIKTPEEILKDQGRYDVVSLWHVLEHIHDLDEMLRKLIAILDDNGFLVVAVPNLNSWDAQIYKSNWAALDLPRHLYHFTRPTIEKLFRKFGMEIAGIYPLKFDAYYISLLSEKTPIIKYAKAALKGWYSNFKARKTLEYSSLIYFIQRRKE